jgi:hypothetical protein
VADQREQMKKELLQAAEVAIDELLDWQEQETAPTLTQIEEVILKLRKQWGQRMAEVVLGEQEARRPVPGPECAMCQREMRYKGQKENGVESRLGILELERGYYYCEGCRSGLFPPGSAVGVVGKALE